MTAEMKNRLDCIQTKISKKFEKRILSKFKTYFDNFKILFVSLKNRLKAVVAQSVNQKKKLQ